MENLDSLDISPRQLADLATKQGKKISEDYVRFQLRNGTIAGHKVGKSWFIPLSVAKKWLSEWMDK